MYIFVPGRLLLLGDHSDWVGQFDKNVETHAIITGINQGIYADVSISDDLIFEYENQIIRCDINTNKLKEKALEGDFFRYVYGTAYHFAKYGGIHIKILKMDLPLSKGLASSAAICVLVTRAFNLLYNLNLNVKQEMHYAYLGETTALSKCGRGDQLCAFGTVPVHVIFKDNDIKINPIKVNGEFDFIIADLNSKKDTTIICNDIQTAFVNNDEKVKSFLIDDNKRFCELGVFALETNDKELLGRTMNDSFNFFDNKVKHCSPNQLEAPVLHKIIEDHEIQKYIYGAKGVGSQGDGSIQFLCKDKKSQQQLKKYLYEKYNMKGVDFTLKQ